MTEATPANQSNSEQPQSNFAAAIKGGEFLITAEVMPPKGGDPNHMLEMAKCLQNRVHAVNVTDGSRAVARMSPVVASAILLQNGIEPICQLACRDRNRIALQADLMGAHALGIRNMLALTGDPVKAGDNPDAKSVFDLESIRLLKLITSFNNGFDSNNNSLKRGSTNFLVGAAVDPQIKSWSGLKSRFYKKVEAGAHFFQSQLICDFDRLDKFMNEMAAETNKPILAGIFLLKSAKNAQFINRCVPGVNIPDSIIERLANAENQLREGMLIAAEQVKIASNICHGVHMMAVRREDLIPEILDMAGISPLK